MTGTICCPTRARHLHVSGGNTGLKTIDLAPWIFATFIKRPHYLIPSQMAGLVCHKTAYRIL